MISVDVYGWLFYKENREIKQKDVQTKYTVNTSDCYVAKERARLQFHKTMRNTNSRTTIILHGLIKWRLHHEQ